MSALLDRGVVGREPENARLQKLGAAGEQLIDQGNIDQASVKLSGSTLSWTKDGQPHSTRLN